MDNPTHYDKVVECEHVNSMSLRECCVHDAPSRVRFSGRRCPRRLAYVGAVELLSDLSKDGLSLCLRVQPLPAEEIQPVGR
jgi:hypothetical protein